MYGSVGGSSVQGLRRLIGGVCAETLELWHNG